MYFFEFLRQFFLRRMKNADSEGGKVLGDFIESFREHGADFALICD